MTADHCGTTEDGSPFCAVSEQGGQCECSSSSPNIAINEIQDSASASAKQPPSSVRSMLMFGIACITSPCCTPLYIPLLIALFAGTPVAAVITQYVGWIYGGLTLISVLSLVFAFRRMKFKQPLTTKVKNHIQAPENGFIVPQRQVL